MNDQEREDLYTLPTYSDIRFPLTFVKGRGSYVFDAAGHKYLDLYGGHAVCVLGHSHPRWVEAVQRQAAELDFYSNLCYHPLRAEAAQLLVEHSYPSMAQVFFCNSGAEANETALKIARRATGRDDVIAFEEGFHGRTIGALSVTGMQKSRDKFPVNLAAFTRFVRLGDLSALDAVDASRVAAVILEPIQSVAGVKMASPDYYRGLRAFCDRHGVVLIFDEVQTGNGRTGEWFIGTHWGVEPDLVTTAKGVGGGFPVGAVVANRTMARTVAAGDQASTFGGGPMAAAAIVATYRTLRDERIVEGVARRSVTVFERLQSFVGKGLREIRGLGYLIGLDCEKRAKDVQRLLMESRILVGTSSDPNTIRLLPPLTVTDDEWEEFFSACARALASV